MFCVDLSMDLFVLCVACLTICLGVVVILLLNVISVECGWRWRCSVGQTVYGLPKNVCAVPVIPG